ncbi:MAG: tryptophan synthase subunit alpha [Actinobacteria bacterium]|nr:tryptophan synthase subunit alpha [Actinomycetota bacterium]
MNPSVETTLRAHRDRGRKLLVPYVTGGLGDNWALVLPALAAAGADAIEIGIPFSDPVMDGPTIQEASAAALAGGATPLSIFDDITGLDVGSAPLIVMTYYNIAFHMGEHRFAASLAGAGISGAILPDLPLEESVSWEREAAAAGVETILLAAPVTPDDRLAQIAARSRGFVYAVGLMGVTGERAGVAVSASTMGKRLKAVTDKPVLIGFGVSTPAQAVDACAEADGVIVGSALVRRLLDGAGPEGAARFIGELRRALDRG